MKAVLFAGLLLGIFASNLHAQPGFLTPQSPNDPVAQ